MMWGIRHLMIKSYSAAAQGRKNISPFLLVVGTSVPTMLESMNPKPAVTTTF
ncbi:MAG TPA: hypothetical protein VEB88_02690 [Candidatus Acidoferrales bacterium]|nr:hypothetical protein [Candidatus Acidoferrales bacterium]